MSTKEAFTMIAEEVDPKLSCLISTILDYFGLDLGPNDFQSFKTLEKCFCNLFLDFVSIGPLDICNAQKFERHESQDVTRKNQKRIRKI